MKKIFTLFAVMGIISSSFAQWNNGGGRGPGFDNRNDNFRSSALVINAFTEKRFTVMVDNMQYQLNADYGRRHDNTINLAQLALANTVSPFTKQELVSLAAKNKEKCIALPCF